MSGHLRMDSRSNSEWKLNAMVLNFPTRVCSSILENVPEFSRLIFGDHVLRNKPCFIPKGTYSVTNAPVNLTLPKVPILPYGHYRERYSISYKKEMLGCFFLEAFIIPPPQRNRG
ncbi:hypothetical protein ONE63_008029 [Megalurothrips usitatus]|uniref:Uncharacterized protein n=1 Tax=Megalurothrips usitatus TaxID=439358 RepID=A0AAV7XT23_9NEOP|nr:hypothetical protein ONE63_008029 [Megalurothrips usitatus]